jgi:hypothetical protein
LANGRNKLRRGDTSRDGGRFVALPWSVLDSRAFLGLSYPARALLLEMARQFLGDNNGRLLCSRTYMAARGWKSMDTLTNAKRELLDAGFLYETVKGQRPNRASWYALTWRMLDRHPSFDAGALEGFKRGVYQAADPLPAIQPKPTREELYAKWCTVGPTNNALPVPPVGTEKNAPLVPATGTGRASIVPPTGTGKGAAVPPAGTIRGVFAPLSVPVAGHLSREPSTGSEADGTEGASDAVGVVTKTTGVDRREKRGGRKSAESGSAPRASQRRAKTGPRDLDEPVPILAGQLGLFGEGPVPNRTY